MSLTEFHKLGFNRKQLHATSATIRGVSGHPVPMVRQSTIVVHSDQSYHTSAIKFIITKQGPSLLSLNGLRALNISVVLLNTEEVAKKP